MKNVLLLSSMLLLVFSGYAGNRKEHKKPTNKSVFTSQVSSKVGFPSELLHNSNQSVVIAYTIGEDNIMHVIDVSTVNDELKQYVIKRLDGKKMKYTSPDNSSGIVKIDFVTID